MTASHVWISKPTIATRFPMRRYLGRQTAWRCCSVSSRPPSSRRFRGDLVVSLYNQKEVWPKFGYEGSSAEHGGYITRGFADIDWLPKA